MSHYEEKLPSRELHPWVRCFWHLRDPSGAESIERIVPDGCCEIVVHLGDAFLEVRRGHEGSLQPSTLLVGQLGRYLDVQPRGPVDVVGIRFHPGGIHPLLRSTVAELNDVRIDLGLLSEGLRRDLEDAARVPGDLDAKRPTLQAALLRHMKGGSPYSLVGRAVAEIEAGAGVIRVEELCGRLRTSERSLERAFRREVGLSPKRFARIVRFQKAFRLGQDSPRNWTWLALDCGYYDQAHLIRDFREFAGESPAGFFQQDHNFSAHFSGQAGKGR